MADEKGMSPESFELLLNDIESSFMGKEKEIELDGIKFLEAAYKARIFFNGLNAKNSKIGEYWRYYSAEYQDYWIPVRTKFGLQTKYVDLHFTGELENGIKPVVSKKETSLEIVDPESYAKANFQEYLQGKKAGAGSMDIFSASEGESLATIKYVEAKIGEDFDDIINKY